MPQDILDYESKGDALAPTHQFLGRMAVSLLAAAGIVGISLLIGIWGYCRFESMSTIDGFLNASMILSGMEPADPMKTSAGKIFAGCYALYSGLALVATTGIVLAPVVHRFLHKFHIEDDER